MKLELKQGGFKVIELFYYNWQVREDWFKWCEKRFAEELVKERAGGMGSILKTLFHVIDCEQIWINQMKRTSVTQIDINSISTLQEVIEYSNFTKKQTEQFMREWNSNTEKKILEIKRRNGHLSSFSYGKIVKHIITHEVHHIGQLSVWSRQLGEKPVSSDLIYREFLSQSFETI
ncbi:putative damage-inducible protein DinB [Bacillus pakistanensis]|uniref:Damage-inducible protein DinB n=1 Tax=Rossellomorea pakistanensis TaxID=992288 RepID=A0ABS2NCA6_9BACI|nr:putative damage-inducible protein DinB [Bacillus pakistanensis]